MPADTELERIRSAAERVATSYGLDIFDVQLRRESIGLVLRVVLDRPCAPGATDRPEDAIGVRECERVSHDLSAILDVDDAIERHYTLEVSSPGLDRPLRRTDDYRRFTGRLAKIVVSEAVDGQRHFEGRLKGVEGDHVVLEIGRKGRIQRIPLAAIVRARLEVEF
ncbi:MAG: ribosome maturation factor RimP [Acidobacteria bacterium]|nr:ribosome maturation factor RimP [Acidobacteriota bacterium]